MKNKFIPYGRQEINNQDIESVVEVLKSDFITQGKKFHYLKSLYLNTAEQNLLCCK